MKDCTVIGKRPVNFGTVFVADQEIRLEHLEPWARAALERGLKAMQGEIL